MLYRKTFSLLLAALLLSSSALARQQAATKESAAPDPERLRAHVTHLASDKLEGRRTGTQGAKDAADYVAAHFIKLGLKPGGDDPAGASGGVARPKASRAYFQTFPYVAGVELGKANALTFTTRGDDGDHARTHLRVGEDWMPLGFGANAKVEGAEVVFVGHGVTAAEQDYDDYKGADVSGKVALALAGTPDGDNPHGRFARAGELRFKAATARAAGARALVVVAASDNFKEDKLARLSYDNSGGDAGLPVVVVSRRAAVKVFGPAALDAGRKGALPGVTLSLSTDVVRKKTPASNVVGVLEGSDPKLKDEYVVVGAHYDHLGRGGQGSLAPREGEIHHGADDNASGVAALLELARLLSAEGAGVRRSVVFVAFGGEEEGLLGSNFYVNNPPVPLEKTVAMLNLDMVGRLRGGNLNVGGVGTASEWRAWVERTNAGWKVDLKLGAGEEAKREEGAAKESERGEGAGKESKREAAGGGESEGGDGETHVVMADGRPVRVKVAVDGKSVPARAGGEFGRAVVTGANGETVATAAPAPRFNLRLNEDGFGPSDHASFYAKRVPVLFFFTGSHEDYHKPTDTADRVNYDGLASITSFVRDIVGEIQASDARPTFTLAKVEATARSTGFRVYLGTIPTYGDSTDGLKLDGVREGSPAEQAGLKAGDVIVRMAGRDVKNVYDYTQALSAMKAGEEYEVEVVRDGARRTFKITPAARR